MDSRRSGGVNQHGEEALSKGLDRNRVGEMRELEKLWLAFRT